MARKTRQATLLSRFIRMIWTFIVGGSIAGWMAPEIPVIGPLVETVVAYITHGSESIKPRPDTADGAVAGTQPNAQNSTAAASNQASGPSVGVTASNAASRKPAGTITVASFNIQVFGNSKLSKPSVVEILARTIRYFDIVAIQEIRSKDDQLLSKFIAQVNADGSRYGYTIGPRLGRSRSTEQYAFIYDVDRVEIDRSSIGNLADPSDMLHREPFVARFMARSAGAVPFSFWLVDIHTDPDEVSTEVDALAEVFQIMQRARADEDDVILLGDLNANDRQFGRLGQIPGITWAVTGAATNTRGTKMYDNLLFERSATAEYTGRWGVFDLKQVFGLTLEQALEVSDHMPVWAEFNSCEVSPYANVASQPQVRPASVARY